MRLHLVILLLFVLNIELFAQCSGGGGGGRGWSFGWGNFFGRSSGSRSNAVADTAYPSKRFTSWDVDTVRLYGGFMTSFAYRNSTWKIHENQMLNLPNLSIYVVSLGKNIGKFVDVGGQLGVNLLMPSTIYQDSSMKIDNTLSFLLNFNTRYFLWQKHRSRIYVVGEAEVQSLYIQAYRKYGTNNTKWIDFLRQAPNGSILSYNDMSSAMLQTERDYIPLTNWTGTWNIGIGYDYMLKRKAKANLMLRTTIGLSRSWGLLQNTWGYKYCEECKESKKVIRFNYDVKDLPVSLPTTTTLFLKLELVFVGIKNANTKRE